MSSACLCVAYGRGHCKRSEPLSPARASPLCHKLSRTGWRHKQNSAEEWKFNDWGSFIHLWSSSWYRYRYLVLFTCMYVCAGTVRRGWFWRRPYHAVWPTIRRYTSACSGCLATGTSPTTWRIWSCSTPLRCSPPASSTRSSLADCCVELARSHTPVPVARRPTTARRRRLRTALLPLLLPATVPAPMYRYYQPSTFPVKSRPCTSGRMTTFVCLFVCLSVSLAQRLLLSMLYSGRWRVRSVDVSICGRWSAGIFDSLLVVMQQSTATGRVYRLCQAGRCTCVNCTTDLGWSAAYMLFCSGNQSWSCFAYTLSSSKKRRGTICR